MNKKILFTDMDGTLLNSEREITPENTAAVQKALEQGGSVVLTSGRLMPSLSYYIKFLNLERPGCYAIASNGATVCDACTNEILFEAGVPRDCIREIFDEAYKFGIHPQAYTRDKVLCERDDDEIHWYSADTRMPYQIVDDVTEVMERDPGKLLFIDLNEREHLASFRSHMQDFLDEHGLTMYLSSDHYMELLPNNINKGSAILFLCDYLGIPLENTIGAGDAENDIPMLETVHTPCVMCNARPEMYSCGVYITENDNNHSGVAEIIEKFML